MTFAAGDGGIVSELQSRHGHSAQPESQQVLAVLHAVLEVIAAQGMATTPTTIFAALMSALERPDAQESPVTTLAMCTVLSTTLARVPNGVLRSKFVGSLQLLSAVVERHRGQAPACKAALQCLGQVLSAVEPGAWASAGISFQLLLSFVTDARPKIRKRATASVTDVLAALQGCPASLAAASEAIRALCARVLPGPAAAQRAAAAASHKQRPAAEAAIVSAVADLLHVLGALKAWAPLMAGPSLPGLIDMLVKLYALRQPLVSRHTSEVLAAVAGSRSGHLSTAQLSQLLGLLVDGEAAQLLTGPGGGAAAAGADQVAAMCKLLEAGIIRLADSGAEADAAAAARLLPRVVHFMVPLLSAEQDGMRYNASGALQSLLDNCATPAVLAAMQQQQQQQQQQQKQPKGGGPGPLASLVAAVASTLGARYQEAWALALPVASKTFEVLAAAGAAAAAAPILTALGQICAGLSDAAEQREAAALSAMEVDGAAAAAAAAAAGSSSYAAAAEAALGSALKHLGPEEVLRVLPLELQQGLAGTGEARTWLLPALRRHVCGAPMCFWARELMPLAKGMGTAAAAASQRGNKGLAAACHALELQLWSCLQAFASWPTDAAQAYPEVVRELAAAFHVREDLRHTISSALCKLCKQARSVALAALDPADSASHLNLSQLNLASRKTQEGLAAAAAVSPETLEAIRALGLVSSAAAAVPRAEGLGEEEEVQGLEEASEDEFEEYGASEGGSNHSQQQQRRRQRQQQEQEEGPDGASHAPAAFTPAVALAQLQALRSFSSQWMSLLCRVYIDVEPEARGPVGDALAAYASISDSQMLSSLYRLTLQKYQKVVQDASAEGSVENPLLEGGSTPEERQASFLELALCLAAGLPDAALDPLFVVCQQHVLGGSSLLQKRAYRVLAYLAGSRPGWLKAHLQQMLELMLLASAAALSPAKRYRLRCLRPIILLLDSTPCPALTGLLDASGAEKVPNGAALAAADSDNEDEAAGGSREAQRQLLLAQTLVGELVLATKEVNKKTRSSAYQLLVDVAHELDDARPLSVAGSAAAAADSDDEMDYSAGASGAELSGGLIDFVNAVMAGLVGASPHMQSAAVLGLSRLVFEFAGQLEGVVNRLLPAVLLLLRSHSREVIKAVLGFIKVCAMRMPVDMLLQWLPQIMEGMLIWSDDSKNKFRLKIRVIIERLVRRCGVEPVAAACPAGDAKLMAHIRKQQARKERRRAGSEAGSQADEAEFDRRSRRSSAARTARASEWGHTAIFSDEAAEEDAQTLAGRSSRGGRSVAGASSSGRRRGQQQQQGSRVQLGADSADPQDLLEPSTARQMVKLAAGSAAGGAARGGAAGDEEPAFPRADDGRFVIKEDGQEARGGRNKRKRRGDDLGFGSEDDSDMEDMRGFAGLDAAVRSVANAKSVRFAPSIAASLGNRSAGQRSSGSKQAGGRPGNSGSGSGSGGKQHTGDRYKSKAGASGDVKGKAAVDPYAYWQFDRKMLNRRRGKQAAATKGLSGIVGGAQAGALKGAKAKRAAAATARVKRAKR